jgi:hypothetical protein
MAIKILVDNKEVFTIPATTRTADINRCAILYASVLQQYRGKSVFITGVSDHERERIIAQAFRLDSDLLREYGIERQSCKGEAKDEKDELLGI